MKHLKTLVFSAFLLVVTNLLSQSYFTRVDSIKSTLVGQPLRNPWAGGLNFCQHSSIDLDLDGIKDLFVFDRTASKINTFLNKGTPGQVDYVSAPDYAKKFPSLTDWALLLDYNCDGKEDIFAFSHQGGGIEIYKNISTPASGLKFVLAEDLLLSKYSSGKWNLYVSTVDIPAIADIDGDGDLDIVTFGLFSQSLEYHINKTLETYGSCDSLDQFHLNSACWGNVYEGAANNDLYFNTPCKSDGGTPPNVFKTNLDGASCELCIDIDGDHDKDIIIGDQSYGDLVLGINGGDSVTANFVSQDKQFPKNHGSGIAVDLNIFPCGFYVDVNNDGLKDLIASPNAPNTSHNFTSNWFFKNKGSNDMPVFEYVQNDFLQNQMIEVGEGAYPVFADVDADGKKDIIIGNYGYFVNTSGGKNTSSLTFLRNIGTNILPAFDVVSRDFDNISSKLSGKSNLAPTFGDLDGDGDLDLIIGNADGELSYLMNTAGAGIAATYSLQLAALKSSKNRIIDVGNFAMPQLVDVNRDGKLDLVIGARNGQLALYLNSGSTANPIWDSISHKWGGVDVLLACCTGFSAPFLYDTGQGYELLVGNEYGTLFRYTNIEGNLTGAFTKSDTLFNNIDEGMRSALSGADINGDGETDLVIGNYAGGIALYMGDGTNGLFPNERLNDQDWSVYPNPTHDLFTVELRTALTTDKAQLTLLDVTGKEITFYVFPGRLFTADVRGLSPGLYFVQLTDLYTHESAIKKIIIQQ